jgi:DNA-binding response OmpR family regulator
MVVVLLYEPDPDVAELLRYLLEHAGYAVQTATDLETVVALAAKVPVIVVDPGAAPAGWERCREVHRRTGRSVIGLLPPDAAAAAPPDVYALPVPVSPRDLRTLVRRLLPPQQL